MVLLSIPAEGHYLYTIMYCHGYVVMGLQVDMVIVEAAM
jgi:hypothetical protein